MKSWLFKTKNPQKNVQENQDYATFKENVEQLSDAAYQLGRCEASAGRYYDCCDEQKQKLAEAFSHFKNNNHFLFRQLSNKAEKAGRQQFWNTMAQSRDPHDPYNETLYNDGDYLLMDLQKKQKEIIQEYEKNPSQFKKR